jgi:cytochrome c
MNTMTATKIVGGVCGSLLVFLLLKWGAEIIYVGGESHDEHAEQAYTIAVADEAVEEEAVEEVSFADLYASADADAGERVFGKCKSCHRIAAGENATGPTMHAVVDRARGAIADFGYSSAMLDAGGEWTPENLNTFLTRPRDAMPGTTMTFAGLPKPEDRANVIAYLATLN